MAAARMVVKVMQRDRSLDMAADGPGQGRHFLVQLLDQALAMRRDDIHAAMASAPPVEKRLRSPSETVAILLVAGKAEGRSAASRGDRQHFVDPLEPQAALKY